MQNAPSSVSELTGLRLSSEELGGGTAKFDLTLFMEDTPQGLNCTWQYNSDLFKPRTIQRLAMQFEQVLGQIAREPEARLRDLCDTLDQRDKEGRVDEKRKLEATNFQRFKTIKPQALNVF
jgi:non-ribosomal peptide synthetase component F